MVCDLYIRPASGSYIELELLDGDLEKLVPIDQSDDGGVHYQIAMGGRPLVNGHCFPTKVRWHGKEGDTLSDFDDEKFLNISARAKALIEEVEPNVHQFFPVDFYNLGDEFLATRYWMQVCNRIDSMDHGRTTMVLRNDRAWGTASDAAICDEPIPDHIDPSESSEIILSLSQIGDAHMWRDKYMEEGRIWLSDKIVEAFKAANISGLQFYETKAV